MFFLTTVIFNLEGYNNEVGLLTPSIQLKCYDVDHTVIRSGITFLVEKFCNSEELLERPFGDV